MAHEISFLEAYIRVRIRDEVEKDVRLRYARKAYDQYYESSEGRAVSAAIKYNGAEGFLHLPEDVRDRAARVTVGFQDVFKQVWREVTDRIVRDN